MFLRKTGAFGFLCDCVIGVSSPNVLKNMIICYCLKRTPLTVIMKQLKLRFREVFLTDTTEDIKNMFTCRPTYFICFNNFNGSGLTAVNLFNIPFSIQKGRFLLLNPLLNWCRCSTRILWHAENNNIELRCLEEVFRL